MFYKKPLFWVVLGVGGFAFWWFKLRKSSNRPVDSNNGTKVVGAAKVTNNDSTSGTNMFAAGRKLNPDA